MCSIFAIFLLILPFTTPYQQWKSIYHKITQDPEFNGFNQMVKNERIAVLNLLYSSVTIFVPENDAIRDFDGKFTSEVILYHMGIEVRTMKLLSNSTDIETVLVENPPLWITVLDQNTVYVNNAKIIISRSNYVAKSKGDISKNQVLHVIDQVLDPMTFTSIPNPNAYDFLNHYRQWQVSNFLTRVQFHNKEDLFQKSGGHTFFIPIDYKMENYQLNHIDSYIIEGHVIPNKVLFTRPTTRNFVFETAANGTYIFIVVLFTTIQDEDYVRSYTVLGNSQHRKGEILAKIVKANIPVANGVVHLISQPLAVFEPELKPFPYLSTYYKISSDPYLNLTFNFGMKGKINKILRSPSSILTYFAPKNTAWEKGFLTYSQIKIEEILERHVVLSNDRFSMDRLVMLSKRGNGTTLNTLSGPIKFKVIKINSTYFIYWNQTRVKVSRPDYECNDGIVHILDDVFGDAQLPHSRKYSENNFWSMLKNLIT